MSKEVVAINVGGEIMYSNRATLCQVEGSLLSIIFGGAWDDARAGDEAGRVFLDYNPKLFKRILNWLRSLRLAGPNALLPEITVDSASEEDFLILVDFLQLQGHLPLKYTETFNGLTLRSPDMLVADTAAWRTVDRRGKYAVATSAHAYFDVCVELSIEVLHFAATEVEADDDVAVPPTLNLPMFVGFTTRAALEDYDLSRDDVTKQKSTYGWWTRSGSTHRVSDGKTSREKGGHRRLWGRGDSLLLTLDCRKQASSGVRVTFTNLTRAVEHTIDVPPECQREGLCSGGWVLLVGMTCPEDKVRLSGARRRGLRPPP